MNKIKKLVSTATKNILICILFTVYELYGAWIHFIAYLFIPGISVVLILSFTVTLCIFLISSMKQWLMSLPIQIVIYILAYRLFSFNSLSIFAGRPVLIQLCFSSIDKYILFAITLAEIFSIQLIAIGINALMAKRNIKNTTVHAGAKKAETDNTESPVDCLRGSEEGTLTELENEAPNIQAAPSEQDKEE